MKVVICVDVTESGLLQLKALQNKDAVISGNDLYFVHCFETKIYAAEFYANYYPTEDQFPVIEKSIVEIMQNNTKSLKQKAASINYACLFSTNPKEAILDYIKEGQAELALVATRGLTGIKGALTSSFADYMTRHSPCDVYILRS